MDEQARGRPRGQATAWLIALGGPFAWTLHLLLTYLVVSLVCWSGLSRTTLVGAPLASVLVVATTIIAASASLYAATISWRRRRLVDDTAARSDTPSALFALAGVALGVLFAVAIVLAGLPAAVLSPCV